MSLSPVQSSLNSGLRGRPSFKRMVRALNGRIQDSNVGGTELEFKIPFYSREDMPFAVARFNYVLGQPYPPGHMTFYDEDDKYCHYFLKDSELPEYLTTNDAIQGIKFFDQHGIQVCPSDSDVGKFHDEYGNALSYPQFVIRTAYNNQIRGLQKLLDEMKKHPILDLVSFDKVFKTYIKIDRRQIVRGVFVDQCVLGFKQPTHQGSVSYSLAEYDIRNNTITSNQLNLLREYLSYNKREYKSEMNYHQKLIAYSKRKNSAFAGLYSSYKLGLMRVKLETYHNIIKSKLANIKSKLKLIHPFQIQRLYPNKCSICWKNLFPEPEQSNFVWIVCSNKCCALMTHDCCAKHLYMCPICG